MSSQSTRDLQGFIEALFCQTSRPMLWFRLGTSSWSLPLRKPFLCWDSSAKRSCFSSEVKA